eukprot:352186-Chlamydomonas_euryale.AAC.6
MRAWRCCCWPARVSRACRKITLLTGLQEALENSRKLREAPGSSEKVWNGPGSSGKLRQTLGRCGKFEEAPGSSGACGAGVALVASC